MLQPTFRFCLSEDLPELQKLVEQLYTTEEYDLMPNVSCTFEEFERAPEKGGIVIIELAGQMVGYAIIVIFWSNQFGGDFVEIDELLIAKESRRSGLGRKFFDWLQYEYRNYVGLTLQVSPSNSDAQRLYESLGFIPSRSHHLVKLLTPVSAPTPH